MSLFRTECYQPSHAPLPGKRVVHGDVIVSLTTMPGRIAHIWPTLHAMLLQTELPKKIVLWLPRTYRRVDERITTLPDFLLGHPLITVKWVDEDYGPATKLLPALREFHGQAIKLIIIDDDILYQPSFIQRLNCHANRELHQAVTFIGSDVIAGKRVKYARGLRARRVDVLHGYGGYLVRPTFFSDAIFDYPPGFPAPFFQDDVWISGWLKRAGVPITQLPHLGLHFRRNRLLRDESANKMALSRHENFTHDNFLKTWAYFESSQGVIECMS